MKLSQKLNAKLTLQGLQKFRAQVAKELADDPPSVFSKHDLLTPEDLDELDAMDFDQRAIIDFEILMRSDFFCGSGHTSFAAELVIRRALLPDAGPAQPVDDKEQSRDNLSMVAGKSDPVFPLEALWPRLRRRLWHS